MTDPTGGAASSPIAIVMGSDSDWPVMRAAADACTELGVTPHVQVLSAHRTPHDMIDFGTRAHERGFKVIVAAAGGAAHLPGMLASTTTVPVIGVPIAITKLDGLDSLLSIVQMPAGIPVATVAVDGARNAGILAVKMLAIADPALTTALQAFQDGLAEASRAKRITFEP
jgi:5-(carboxyamino)imidazole ribonucleotide mutase